MHRHFVEVFNHWQGKILAGLWATIYSDDLPMLLLIFISLEVLDIFTKWLCLSRKLFLSMYPQTECNLWQSFLFINQARKWHVIKSDEMRKGFCDKMMIYLLLLLLAALVDGALSIAGTPRMLLTITVTVLATTEALSILENLSDSGVEVIAVIKDKFVKKIG